MAINRRNFLKIMGGTTAAFAFPGVIIQGFSKALKAAAERTPVIWLHGQSCSGCSVSLLNSVDPDITTIITEYISLNFHQTVCAGAGDACMKLVGDAADKRKEGFVLVVEGSIPTKHPVYSTLGAKNGKHIGIDHWVKSLGENAIAVLAVGTCATFGGIPAARGNKTGAVGIIDFFKKVGVDKPVINIAGCPPHPDWIVGTIVHLILKGKPPKMDKYNRPLSYFENTVHENCENLGDYRKGIFAKNWGDKGCLYMLGCLGMDTGCDIPVRKWNDGANSCTGSGSGCIGCTEEVYPDTGSRGLYKHLKASADEINQIEDPIIREAVIKIQRNGGMING